LQVVTAGLRGNTALVSSRTTVVSPKPPNPALPYLLTAGAGGAAVIAAGLLIHATPDGAQSAVGIACPFQEMTGLPCPLCGATRSLGLLAQGDGSFLQYNPVWAILVVAGIPLMLVLARRPAWRTRLARVPLAVRVALVGALVVMAWSVALANRAAIVTG
jgi:Protein of unknown function (DUF2752)